jgi:hypothetical protein
MVFSGQRVFCIAYADQSCGWRSVRAVFDRNFLDEYVLKLVRFSYISYSSSKRCAVFIVCAEFVSLYGFMYGDRGSTVVKVLRYKSEGRWFDPR